MPDSGEFNIEIDAEEGLVVITTAQGVPYTYTVEELEGKGILDRLKSGGAQEVIYSQGQTFTREEYNDLYGDDYS